MTKTFLILRPKDEALTMSNLLTTQGFNTIIEPLFEVEFLSAEEIFKQKYQALLRFTQKKDDFEQILQKNRDFNQEKDKFGQNNTKFNKNKVDLDIKSQNYVIPDIAIIITSANAATGVILAQIDKNTPIFAIGQKTAQNLLLEGYKNIIYAKNPNALSLKEKILQSDKKNLLYFCTSDLTIDFKIELAAHNYAVEEILCYKILWKNQFSPEFLHKIGAKSDISDTKNQNLSIKIDFIFFYSQNSVKNFANLVKKHNLLEYFSCSTLLCLSDKIVDAVKKYGFNNKTKIFGNNSLWLKQI